MIKNEWIKLTGKKTVRVFGIFYILLLIGVSMIYLTGENRLELSLFDNGQFLGTTLRLLMALFLPLGAIFLAANAFALDLSEGNIKNLFLLPVKNAKIF